jgi:hypothetical protein
MKPNKKIIDLIENGFSYKTISKFSPKQLDDIHSRIVKEQTTTTNILKVPKGSAAEKDAQNKKMTYMTYEGELEEKKSKKRKSKNPWAICTSSLSDEFGTSERSEWTKSQLKKYERCVMDVKEKMNEGKNPFEVILENKITQLIEKHVHPKMTKKDFLEVLTKKMIQESKTKEKEKEKTKPTTKPAHPLSPKPGPNPRPKAKKSEMDEGDTKTKPTTKPGTKPTTKPGHPFSPKPGPNPAPKAKKGNIPDWFTFDKLGLKIK